MTPTFLLPTFCLVLWTAEVPKAVKGKLDSNAQLTLSLDLVRRAGQTGVLQQRQIDTPPVTSPYLQAFPSKTSHV